ncbi:MAG: TonB-dependent receptor [Porticoccaceae bacterium]|nr:TonB-dependent receptor [Porticoccaceae bacterium]
MKKFINLSLGLSLVPFFALSSVNAEEVQDVENIIVTESRIPTIVSESLSSISIIEREDIERYQASDLYDLMARLPGVSLLRNGGKGTATSLSIRGNQGDHSLFLVDGVRIGSATLGSATLGLINTNSIERIEIVRGPKSNLYGADAIGGVVNIITRDSSESDSLLLKSSTGSNGTQETTVSAGTNNGPHSYSVLLNTFETDGIDSTYDASSLNGDKDGHTNDGVAFSYRYDDGKAKWKLSYTSNDTTTDYDKTCGPWVGWVQDVKDCDIYTDTKIASLSSSLDYEINDTWVSNIQFGRSVDEAEEFARNINLSDTGDDGIFNTEKTEATWFNVLSLADKSTLSFGFDYQNNEVVSSEDYDESSRDNKAAFVQYQSNIGSIETNFGLRRDDNEQFGMHTTGSVLAGVDLNDNLRLISSYGEGFKAPTFNDLYYPDSGNPDFLPEQSKNIEVGLKANWDSSTVGVTLFNNQLENLIQYNFATQATDQTAEVEISGIEFSLDTEVAGWMVGLSGTLLNPEDKSTGNLLRRRAERSASLDADYSAGNFGAGFSIYSQSHTFDNAANTVRYGGYTTLALRANFDLSDNWAVKVNANNLTDKEYVTASGFLGNYRSMGRELFLTIAYTPSL